jgi:hypothetical protein
MNKSSFIKAVKRLKLKPEDYIVIGSGILVALEIRDADDVDIVASKDAFDKLTKDTEWTSKILEDGTQILIKDIYEVGLDRKTQKTHPTLEELKQDQVIIDDIPFISLKHLMDLKFKRGLEKDMKDIDLIKRINET